MVSVQRAFAQKLSSQHASDVRKHISSSKNVCKNVSHVPRSSYSPCDIVDPPDFEDFILQHQSVIDRDQLRSIIDFPSNDIQISIEPRKMRTKKAIMPKEPISSLSVYVRYCIEYYTRDWIIIEFCYRHHSTSSAIRDRITEREIILQEIPYREFEVDACHSDNVSLSGSTASEISSARKSVTSQLSCDTYRSSWASFDLLNSVNDPLMLPLLNNMSHSTVDQMNERKRREGRQDALMLLYPPIDAEECVERRPHPEVPVEPLGHRILIRCLHLKLELDIEPIFACLALYDCKEKRKVSENFYFDMNSDDVKKLLTPHVPFSDTSTGSKSCILNITYPSPDLFLVIKLEKILQGDINECVEPYIKDEKNLDKVKLNAMQSCERLGKYRMPFCWTAVYLMNVINGKNSLDRDSISDRDSIGSNSLGSSDDRKMSGSSLEHLRKRAGEIGFTRKGSLERKSNSDKRTSWSSEDITSNFETFLPVTLTISSFFKQEYDRLRDDDLYKFLQDLKRPCSALKKLKTIPGILKLDISPLVDDMKDCLTPELECLLPCSKDNTTSTKELLEFPSKEVYASHYLYRNLLYIYPKELNFTGRTGNARNIAIKMEVKYGENSDQNLEIIFGKSSCPQYLSEVYAIVNYHSKCPYFYDEFKIQLPANIAEQHHLFFTFYHVSCQRKPEASGIEIPVGYTWLPLLRDGRLRTGDFCLPVSMEYPPSNYSYITPDVALPGIKWIDNHKGLFSFSIEAASSIHTMDAFLDDFFSFNEIIEQGPIPPRLADSNLENELKNRVLNLSNAKLESLVKFLPIVMNKLLLLLVKPPEVNGMTFNIGQVIFESIGLIVKVITTGLPEVDHDSLVGWHNILSTYVAYQCIIPHPINSCILMHQCGKSYLDTIDLLPEVDREIDFYTRGITCMCNVTSDEFQDNILSKFMRTESTRILHEELALQWVVTSGSARENAVANSWFFFDLIIKSMVEYLASTNNLDAPRKYRFSEQFLDDIATLVTTFTSDIISGYNKDIKLIQSINASLAFFLYDLFSIADRGFVFIMLKTYYKHMSTKIATLPDAHMLSSLKVDFMRILFSHEHFFALNLPFGTPFTGGGNLCSSPSPSVSSNNSQSSYISYITAKDTKKLYAENSVEFRRHHYLNGLLFSDLANILDMSVPLHHNKIISLLRNLMTSHDSDARYAQEDKKARVTALYLPLLFTVMDMLPQLHSWNNDHKGRSLLVDENENEPSFGIHQSIAMAIAGTSVFGIKEESVDTNKLTQQSRKTALSNEASQNLFICFLWVLKNMDKEMTKCWWAEWSVQRIRQLLEVLNICTARFEYKGKRVVKTTNQQQYNKTLDIKSRLEDVILGQGSARSELMMRRKGGLGDRLRWRKDHLSYRSTGEVTAKPKQIIENGSHVEGNLAAEVSFIILDTLELIVQVIAQCEHFKCLMEAVFKVLLHGLSRNQSACVLQSMFATQRSIVSKFPNLLFVGVWEHCADLCLLLLKHCSSNLSTVRSPSAASLYMLMRQSYGVGNNFARIKMQVTMSLSSLVGTSHSFNEVTLRRSLKTILLYSEQDQEFNSTTFPEQVKDLVFNLHMILSDTVKMKEYQEDPEMLLDLMHRIAKGYQNSPDLRVTWLNNMAQKHMELNNHTEAAMCLVHSAALVSEYLYMLDSKPNLIVGVINFEKVSPNVLEERVIPDDAVSPKEEGFCLGKDFTLSGLVGILEHAASNFQLAGMFEAMDAVYKVMIPIIERNHDYKKLANIYGKLHEAYTRLDQLQGKRIFGTYFRIGFYGTKFGDLNEEEFVYKEPTLTKLSEIFSRLQNFYTERFGPDAVQIIKDSNTVHVQQLDPSKAYIQITYVEPYFDKAELRERPTGFERNFNIRRFMYATPFTMDGRAHGELYEQYKRKTLLTVANYFPYVKTRIQVVSREQIILTPIEVAIEDIQKKTTELANSLQQDPPDTKILQMVLQGCIGTTVNQGPMEIAIVFLSGLSDGSYPVKLQNKLRLCFKEFMRRCSDALKKNKHLIGPDQRDYQRELERNYHRLTEKLTPLITIKKSPDTVV